MIDLRGRAVSELFEDAVGDGTTSVRGLWGPPPQPLKTMIRTSSAAAQVRFGMA